MLVKKYGNRRLYDTELSRYITLDELAQRIREGSEARVLDAKTSEDLTQATLTQIIIESRGGDRLLPAPMLHQLIRLGDDALAEFFGRYLSMALEAYVHLKQGTQAFAPFNPFSGFNPFGGQVFGRALGAANAPQPAPPAPEKAGPSDVELLRRELDALKQSLKKPKRSRR
jgi:polyhydroxyalkanoate synthesis repressor PhaR